jgi:hypothetical protein
MSAAGPSPVEDGVPLGSPAFDVDGAVRWEELLHDWQVRSEHDGGYVLLRCRVCGTDTLR